MKFGKYYNKHKIEEWSEYYVDYKLLKKNINNEHFLDLIHNELQKVNSFHELLGCDKILDNVYDTLDILKNNLINKYKMEGGVRKRYRRSGRRSVRRSSRRSVRRSGRRSVRRKALKCWTGYERVPGTRVGAKGSCRKKRR